MDWCRIYWGKSRFRVVITQKQFIPVFLFINDYIIFHIDNCKPTRPTPCIHQQPSLYRVELKVELITFLK